MKTFLVKIFIIGMAYIFINQIYLVLINNYSWNLKKIVEANSFRGKSFELIVLGNSLAMDGIDTEYLTRKGMNSYNMAAGGLNHATNYKQLKYYLGNNSPPKIVILGLTSCRKASWDLYPDPSIRRLVEFVYDGTLFDRILMPMPKLNMEVVKLIKYVFSSEHRNARIILGQLKSTKTKADLTSESHTKLSYVDYNSRHNPEYIFRIDSLCKVYKTKLICIEMPGFKETQNADPFLLTINGMNHLDTIDRFNFNNSTISGLIESEYDWLGDGHLNERGAQKFTEYLYTKLLMNY